MGKTRNKLGLVFWYVRRQELGGGSPFWDRQDEYMKTHQDKHTKSSNNLHTDTNKELHNSSMDARKFLSTQTTIT